MGKRKYKYITISSEERLALTIGADILSIDSKNLDDVPLSKCKDIVLIIENLLERSKHEEYGSK